MADDLIPPASEKRIGRQKRLQAVTSVTAGTLGLTALALRGRSSQLNRNIRLKRVPTKDISEVKAKSQKYTDASTYLTTTGAGVGGVGAFNFASYTNAEGKKDIKKGLSDSPTSSSPVGFFGPANE